MRKSIQQDIKRHELKEPEFRDSIQKKWNCDLYKLAIVYGFDYAIVKDGELKGFVELKRRLFESYKYKDSMINLNKWLKAKELREGTNLPTFLAIRYNDRDVYCKLTNDTTHYIKWGARTKQTRDWQDIQPACHIVIEEFKSL
jgi:hypothetical protein